MTLEDYDNEVADLLTDDPEERENIITAFQRARDPFAETSLIPLQESFAYLCFWVGPISRMRARTDHGPQKIDYQFAEKYLASGVESLKTALMSYMSNLKSERGNF